LLSMYVLLKITQLFIIQLTVASLPPTPQP
jgi:hypothetical protein